MNTFREIIENRNSLAWIILATAIGLHVFDEAMTNFLPTYNQIVLDLRRKLGFFPFPTFSKGFRGDWQSKPELAQSSLQNAWAFARRANTIGMRLSNSLESWFVADFIVF